MTHRPLDPTDAGIRLDGLLGTLGIVDTRRHDTVTAHLTDVLADRGVTDFTVSSLVRNRLVLAADPQTVALLRYDTGTVLTELNTRLADPVKSLRLVVTRTGYPAGPDHHPH